MARTGNLAKGNTFSSENQPKGRRGRKPNRFAKLAKTELLTKSDVQGLCSLILTSQSSDLSDVLKRFPCILTETLIAQLAQDRAGVVGRPTKTIKDVKGPEDARTTTTEYEFAERLKSMDTVAWMTEQVIGKATQPTELEITTFPDTTRNKLGEILSTEKTRRKTAKTSTVMKEKSMSEDSGNDG
jgi:hypothetical protein